MLKTFIMTALVLSLGLVVPSIRAQETPAEGQYAPINGLNMYYEIHGQGDPLILLHGGLGGIVEFGALLPALAETRQVIAVELQGHGHTADIERPMNYEVLADDVAALIEYLDLEQADVMGYSLGGGVALRTAIQHPEAVRKLVLVSATFSSEGIHPEFRMGMQAMSAESAAQMLETPMYQFYASVAPKLDDWATFVGKVGAMTSADYDWTEAVKTVAAPTLILAGDNDMFPPSHAVELFSLLGGGVAGGMLPGLPSSQLAILPHTMHFDILTQVDVLLPIVNPFLDAPVV